MDLKQKLYEKAAKEQREFVDKLRRSDPEAVIEQAYELVMREDILIIFEDGKLKPEYVKALLKLDYPLSACYDKWLKTDCSHMEMLKDTVEDLASGLVKMSEQKKGHKKTEPER